MTASTGSQQARGVLILTPLLLPDHRRRGEQRRAAGALPRRAGRARCRCSTKRIGQDLPDDAGSRWHRHPPHRAGRRAIVARQMADDAGDRALAGPPRRRNTTSSAAWTTARPASRRCSRAGSTAAPVVFQAQTTGVLSGDNVDPLLEGAGIGTARPIARAIKVADPSALSGRGRLRVHLARHRARDAAPAACRSRSRLVSARTPST